MTDLRTDQPAKRSIEKLEKRLKPSGKHLFRKFVYNACLRIADLLLRLVELLAALIVVVVLVIPLALLLFLRKIFTGKAVIVPEAKVIVGKDGGKLDLAAFNLSRPGAANLLFFCYVLTGKLGIVGAGMEDFSRYRFTPESAYLHAGRPGIVSLWHVRRNSNIGHEGRVATEWEYRFTHSPASDLLLILRAVPAYVFGNRTAPTSDQINLFDITFANLTMQDAIELIQRTIVDGTKSKSFFFINPDCLNKTFSDDEYREVLVGADYIFPDGIGLTIAGKIIRSPLRENVNGTDMLPFLCEMAAAGNHSIFLLGGQPGVAEKMAENLTDVHRVRIAGTQHGYFDRSHENDAVLERINASGADIVLVAFGAPLQEKWIAANSSGLDAAVVMGVGGLFDFYSGNTRRAPRWMREIGLEWFYRIMQEPGRMWKRYVVGNPLFLMRVVLWKLRQGNQAREE